FLFSIISKTGLEKSEDFSRPVLFLETYVTASFLLLVDHSAMVGKPSHQLLGQCELKKSRICL
ncbi:hypothetical protein, partial [Lactiplantibacillus plantarum]|uniref:hypothetical protein n=1 Tax=Lactiplantibacillus plantarum TaxID=1590 RepID=UPI00218212EB